MKAAFINPTRGNRNTNVGCSLAQLSTPIIGTVRRRKQPQHIPMPLPTAASITPTEAKFAMLDLFHQAKSPTRWRERAWKSFLKEDEKDSVCNDTNNNTTSKPIVANPWKSPSWSTSGSPHLSATTMLLLEARAELRGPKKLPPPPPSPLTLDPLPSKKPLTIATANGHRLPRRRMAVPSPVEGVDDADEEVKNQAHEVGPPSPVTLDAPPPGESRLPFVRPPAAEVATRSPPSPVVLRDDDKVWDTVSALMRVQKRISYSTPPPPSQSRRVQQFDGDSCATSPLKSAVLPPRKGSYLTASKSTEAVGALRSRHGIGSSASSKLRGSVKQHMDSWRQAGLTQLLEDPSKKLTYSDVRMRLGLPSLVAAAAAA